MGRKKSYKKQEPRPAAPAAAESEGGADDGSAEDTLPVPAAGGSADQSLARETSSEPAGPALTPQVIAGRPEWAAVAPARLEAAEDESFWFAFSLAVMACAPTPLASIAAVLGALLAGRILRALWSVPSDVAPDDMGNARMLLFVSTVTSGIYRATQMTMLGLMWMMVTIFFFNSLHNVRVMVGLALGKGKKKKKGEQPKEVTGGR